MSYSQYPEYEDYHRRINATNPVNLFNTVASIVVGAVFLSAVLELSGHPIRHLLNRLVHMASDVLGLQGTTLDPSIDSEVDDMQRSGGMFGSLFNLPSPTSLLQKGVRGVAGALSLSSGDKPPGLGNRNNACYQNSVMQGLASLPSLRDYLSNMTTQHPSLDKESVNGALLDMVTDLNNPNNKGRHFWIQGKLKSMSTWEQQDAQEYYSKILDGLDEEIKKASSSKRRSSVSFAEATRSLIDSPETEDEVEKKPDTGTDLQAQAEQPKIVPNPLDGLLAQRVGCTSCGYSEGLTLIPSNCITVSLGKNYGYDVRECLDEYTALEFIDGVECAKCTLLKLKNTLAPLAEKNPGSPFETKLNAVQEALDDEDFEDKTLIKTFNVAKKNWVQSRKSKQAVVARAPKALILHVNRSSFNEYTGEPYKNTAGVSYPSTLDLGNWCLGNTPSGSQHTDMSLEEWPRDPNKSMLSDLPSEPMTDSPFQYRLRAAVIHHGTHGYGHYICYRPLPGDFLRSSTETEDAKTKEGDIEEEQMPDEQWWKFSDDSVYAVAEADAHQGNVFMLFYERIDELSVLPPRSTSTTLPVAEDAPLPPADIVPLEVHATDDLALSVALPEEDDLLDLIPPQSAVLPAQPDASISISTTEVVPPMSVNDAHESAYQDSETEAEPEMSEAGSDAPSTQLTSDYESEADSSTPPTSPAPKLLPIPPISPHMMRTAGNAAARGQGKRQSLPLVSAT